MPKAPPTHTIDRLYTVIQSRRDADPDESNTARLFARGVEKIAQKLGEEAVQIHGGMGVTWDLDVAHFFKRLTAINRMFGNADWHLDKLAT